MISGKDVFKAYLEASFPNHKGRPGKRGGSSPRGFNFPSYPPQLKPYPKGELVQTHYTELRKQQEAFSNKIVDWIQGRSEIMPKPDWVYRGVPKGMSVTPQQEGEYMHGTPWPWSAARAGKGVWGDPNSNDVYRFPYSDDQLFYRGGALIGDPLEYTAISNMQGKTWPELMTEAKALYQKRLATGTKSLDADNWANETVDDLAKAAFETDLGGKPGIWRGKELPYRMDTYKPRLRSNTRIRQIVMQKLRQGIRPEDIAEMHILKRIKPRNV
jgi:hypothetical protein